MRGQRFTLRVLDAVQPVWRAPLAAAQARGDNWQVVRALQCRVLRGWQGQAQPSCSIAHLRADAGDQGDTTALVVSSRRCAVVSWAGYVFCVSVPWSRATCTVPGSVPGSGASTCLCMGQSSPCAAAANVKQAQLDVCSCTDRQLHRQCQLTKSHTGTLPHEGEGSAAGVRAKETA